MISPHEEIMRVLGTPVIGNGAADDFLWAEWP